MPKRFGVGWTVNLARPAAGALAGILVLIAVVGIATPLLKR